MMEFYRYRVIIRLDILRGQALFRGVKHLLTKGQKEKKEKKEKKRKKKKKRKKRKKEKKEKKNMTKEEKTKN